MPRSGSPSEDRKDTDTVVSQFAERGRKWGPSRKHIQEITYNCKETLKAKCALLTASAWVTGSPTRGGDGAPREAYGLLPRKMGAEREGAPLQGPGMQQVKGSPWNSTTPPAPLPSRSKSLKPKPQWKLRQACFPPGPLRERQKQNPSISAGSWTKTYRPLDWEACTNNAELCHHQRKGERRHGYSGAW